MTSDKDKCDSVVHRSVVLPRPAPPWREVGCSEPAPLWFNAIAQQTSSPPIEEQRQQPNGETVEPDGPGAPIRLTGHRVSVIVPTWNCGAYLEQCLDSLLAQTYQAEIIVVDDGSTDGSPEVLQRYSDRVQVIRHSKRRGANAARNTGLQAAFGDWVIFADADAVYGPIWIERMLQTGASDTSLGVVYSGFTRQFDGGRSEAFASRDWSLPALWWENYIAMPSLVRRDAVPASGLDETFDVYDDWQLWLDVFRRGWRGRRVADNLFTAFVRQDGRTRQFQRDLLATALAVARIRRMSAGVVGAEEPIGVVIPACGGEDLTIRCLQRLAQFCGVPFRVFYVDNGSGEGTVTAVREAAAMQNIELTILENPTNEGFTSAVNRGLRAAGYRHALVLNNDCFVAPDCVERLWWTLAHQQWCAAAGPLSGDRGAHSLRAPGAVQRARAHPSVLNHLDDSVRIARLLSRQERYDARPKLAFFCTLLHRDAVRHCGLLDDRFPSGLGADDEWCYRVRHAGWRCLQVLNAYAAHMHSETFRRLGLNYNQLHREAIGVMRTIAAGTSD